MIGRFALMLGVLLVAATALATGTRGGVSTGGSTTLAPGTGLWSTRYDGPTGNVDEGTAIVWSGLHGRVFVTGLSSGRSLVRRATIRGQ
jgi:nitrous oxide reductase